MRCDGVPGKAPSTIPSLDDNPLITLTIALA